MCGFALAPLESQGLGAFHSKNPYEVPISPRWTVVQFRNEMQVRIVHELSEHNKNRYAKQWTIDLDHWRNNLEYFGEALALCEEFDLIKLMSVNCDFDVQLVHQFYATVHFGEDDAWILTFMCRYELFQVPWRAFCNAIVYEDTGLERNGGIHPHDHHHSMLLLLCTFVVEVLLVSLRIFRRFMTSCIMCFAMCFCPRLGIRMRYMGILLTYLLL